MEVTAQAAAARRAVGETSDLDVLIRKRFSNVAPSFDLDVQFRIGPGFTILFGPSGAGKTTVLDSIAGLTRPDEGRISIAGQTVFDSDKKQDVTAWKRNIGYVLQDLALPSPDTKENVAFGLHVSAVERYVRRRCLGFSH
jgi:molybdate transport system ATP-binding protein